MFRTINKKTILLLFAIMALMLVACTPDGSSSGDVPVDRPGTITDEITMFVGPEMVDCVGVGPQKCLQVKFEKDAEWELLYSGIEGFEHEEGIEYELRVNKIQSVNQPADASSINYELVEIVSQSETETADMENLDQLTETEWDLVTINGEAPVDGTFPTLNFDEEQINGTTGCNSYFAGYTLDGTNLSVEQAGQTEMFCEGRMEQEQAYLQMLMSAVSLTLEKDTLTIHTSEGDLVYAPATHEVLEGPTWHLSGLTNESGGLLHTWIDERITAEFADGNLGGSSACNSYSTTYELDGSSITTGDIVSTLMACEDEEINQREAEFLGALQNIASYEIFRDNLTLYDADGNVIITFSSTLPEA